MVHLTQSPYIEFRENPYTSPLVASWQMIRDRFVSRIGARRRLEETTPALRPSAMRLEKPNGITKNFNQPLYHGKFDGLSMFLRDTLLDDNEKATIGWRTDERIRWNESFWQDIMPFVNDHIRTHKDVIGSVTFNTSYPGSKLNHHWGLDPAYLRIHICLVEAQGCVFDIEGWKREWKDGEMFGFDDANVLHGTSHVGTRPRTIMIADLLKTVMREYAESWPCRESRPPKERWSEIMVRAGIAVPGGD